MAQPGACRTDREVAGLDSVGLGRLHALLQSLEHLRLDVWVVDDEAAERLPRQDEEAERA